MITFTRISPDEIDARHARYASPRRAAPVAVAPPHAMNVQQVLDLGNLTFFTFQGRAYGVPPLPYKAGVVLQKLWLDALQYKTLTPETLPKYTAIIAQFPVLFWRHCRPDGWRRRIARVLRLMRNPFLAATEKDLIKLADFFLECRMKSSVQSLKAPSDLAPTIL